MIVDHEGRQREFAPVLGRPDGRAMIQRTRSRCGYHEIQYFYDQRGQLEWVRDCGDRVIRLAHDARGRLVELHLPHPEAEGLYRHRRYAYDGEGDLVEVEDSLGHRWRFEYITHLLTRETDRNGLRFYFAYDGLGEDAWCVRTWGDGGIYDHEIAYDKQSHATFVTNSLGHTTQYFMNVAGQVIKVVDPLGSKTCFEYDPRTLQQIAITDPLGQRNWVELDDRRDCVALHQADGATNTRSYDPQLRVLARSVEPHGADYRWDHDSAGRMRARIGPLGDITRYDYDHGLLSAILDPDGVGQRFEYDVHKNLVAARRSDSNCTLVTRDRLGRVITHQNRRGGTQRRVWDTEGRQLELREPHGVVRHFEYDAEANLLAASYAGRRIDFEYTARNRPSLRREAGTTIRLEYDTEVQLRSVDDEAGNQHSLEFRPIRSALGAACGPMAIA